MFFSECLFAFLMTQFLGRMGMLNASKSHCQFRKILGKQLSQVISCFKNGFKIASHANISIFYAKSNMTVKVFKDVPKDAAV